MLIPGLFGLLYTELLLTYQPLPAISTEGDLLARQTIVGLA